MTDIPKELIKKEVLVSCLSCGQTTETFVSRRESGGLYGTTGCPKCSNTAYTNNLRGLWSFMRAAANEIAQLKLAMVALQDDGEDR